MESALTNLPDRWYEAPNDVLKGASNSYFLQDAPKVDHLPNDNPMPTPNSYGVPNDPGTGPVKADGRPLPWAVPPQAQGQGQGGQQNAPGRTRPLPPTVP
jgi:hypothetical protein